MNFFFLLNKNFPIVQSPFFVIIPVFFLCKLMFLLNILKDLLNLHFKGKCETELRNFFSLIFNGSSMIYAIVGDSKNPLKQNLAFKFYIKQKKGISVLTEIHINHDQMHNTRNNCLLDIFLVLEILIKIQ